MKPEPTVNLKDQDFIKAFFMLAISTSFISQSCENGNALIETLERMGVWAVELEYRIRNALFAQMREGLKSAGIQVTSIHNYFPFPQDRLPGATPGGDLFLLSDSDPEGRKEAVKWTVRSLEHADQLEAGALVLHCGWVQMDHQKERIRACYKDGGFFTESFQRFFQEKLRQREALKSKHLDGLLWSLDRLAPVAEKYGVWLGLENRFHYHELPGPAEFATVFAEFESGPIGYWHDTGHAHAQELLRVIKKDALLRRFGDKLIGIHLHDATGLGDHLPPGQGEIDFEAIRSYLKPDTRLVVELRPGTSPEDAVAGLAFLREKKIA